MDRCGAHRTYYVDAKARSRSNRKAAYAMHAKYSAKETTSAARAAFFARFEKQVDPDGVLDPEDRKQRAKAAMHVYMKDLNAKRHGKKKRRRSRPVDPDDAEIIAILECIGALIDG